MDTRSPGQIGYESYFDFANGRSLATGQDLPQWSKLTWAVKAAWEKAAGDIVQNYIEKRDK